MSLPPVLPVFTTRRETRSFYDKISRYYDALSDHTEAPIRKEAAETIVARAGERVLEIGCGTGHTLVDLSRDGARIVGLDLSMGMLHASKNLPGQCASLICGDGSRIPLRDHSTDGILMCFTLELFDTGEIPVVLAECRRVLKPGGRIVVAGMSKESPGGLAVEMYEWSHRHFPNFVDCRPIFVRRSLQEGRFVIERSVIRDMWLPVEIVLGRPA